MFDSYISNSSDSDLSNESNDTYNVIENCRGKGNDGTQLDTQTKKKLRLTTYMLPLPEIKRILNRKKTRGPTYTHY